MELDIRIVNMIRIRLLFNGIDPDFCVVPLIVVVVLVVVVVVVVVTGKTSEGSLQLSVEQQ